MSPDSLIALAGFAFAGTWTPGPNNMMLASSGATFGWRRTWPHAFGVALGFPVMQFLIALGLGEAFQRSALLRESLLWVGFGMMLWLAWRIFRARPAVEGETGSRPLTFLEASAFQWVNPKAWAMAIGVAATYVSGAAPVLEAATAAGLFLCAGITSAHAWSAFGAAMGKLLGVGWRLRVFNGVMAALLTASAFWLLIDAKL